jgi:hypothetical protein
MLRHGTRRNAQVIPEDNELRLIDINHQLLSLLLGLRQPIATEASVRVPAAILPGYVLPGLTLRAARIGPPRPI